MSKNLNNAELVQELEAAEKRIAQLEGDLARKARLLDEYERTDRECQEREQKLNQLLEILPVGISILDAEENIVYSNPALQKILQINQEGLLNGSYRDRMYMASDRAPMPPDGFASRKAKQSGEPVYDVETGILIEDGNTIWTSVSAIPVDFSDWKIVLTTTDITTRKNAQEERRRSEQSLSKIFHASPAPMAIGDAETGQFIEINQAYERLVGYERNELLGHTPFELALHADPEQVVRARQDVLAQGSLQGAELTLRTKSGELRNILAWSQVLRLSNQQVINLGTTIDVTGQKRMEQSLRESEARYRSLFENSPVAIWEEDFSKVKAYLDDLKRQGVTDLDAYLNAHPEVIQECITLIQITDVNQASINLHGLASKAELLGSLGNAFPGKALAGFKNELLKVASGGLDFHGESFIRTSGGHLRSVIVDWVVSPGYEQTYAKVLVTLSDITDLKRAQEKFQEIFEHSAEGIFQTTPDGRFLSANPALARIYGYDSPQELIESLTDIAKQLYLKPAERQEFIGLLESKGAIERFETTDRRKDGTIIWTSASARVVRDVNGRTLYYEGSLQDITERKQAQQALTDNEKRFRAMIENGLDDISLLDAQGHLLWESPSVVRNLGYAPDEYLGRDMFELIHPEDRGWTNDLFAKLLHEPGSRQHGAFRLRHANGSWRWVEAVGTNLLDEPSVGGLVINYRDITERKQAEEARHEAELRYRALFEQSHDAIFILDLEGGTLAVNPRAADMLGYSSQELLGRSATEISAEQTQSRQVLQELLNGQHIPIYERLFRKKDGSTFPVEINVELVRDSHGNPLHIQSVVRDITDRRRAEIELQQRNEDLGLINAINEIIVQGGNLETVVSVLAKEMKRIFSSQGTSLYMLSPDGRSLTMQQYAMPTDLTRKIEQLIGSTIPIVKIPLQEGGLFERVLQLGRGLIISDPKEIQTWLTGFAETEFLPSIARGAIRKLMPRIQKLLNIKSTIIIPLRSQENTIGLLNVSSAGSFAGEDLKRIESISVQLTTAIQHQQANEKIQRSEQFLNSIQNALSASIAILDETGTVVRVNSAWRKFGEQNGLTDPQACIGMNYLDICDSARGANAEEAPVVARAIREVIAGRSPEAWVEYPCHSPEQQRWFLLRMSKFEDGDKFWVVLAHEDITERKQAQDALQWSASIFTHAGKMAHLGAWEIAVSNPGNLNENALRWSDEVYRIFGYKPDEVTVTNDLFFGRVHPEDQPKVQEAMSQAIASKKPFEVEHRIIRPDGVERIVEERADLIYDQQGQLIQILGAVQDITERKRTEQALRETSDQFRALFEASPEAIMLVDPHGNWPILDCNATACSMNGYARQELIGQTIDILTLSPGDAAGRLEYLEKVRSAGILRFEDFHRHKNGNIFPIEISTSLITVGGREIILGIDREITERKQAEQTLRKSEALYRQAIEVAGAVPYYESYYGNGQFIKYEFIGEGIRQITGYGPEEFSAQLWDTLVEEVVLVEDLAGLSLDEGIQRVRTGDHPIWKCEHRLRARDGSIHWVFEAAVELRDEHGISQGSIGMYQDITNRKQAEQALRDSEKRYRALFEDMPIAIWEEDFSAVKKYLDSLKQQGITDFRTYFESHPETLLECAHQVKILDVNNSAVQMYHANSEEQLLRSMEGAVSETKLKQFQAVLISLAAGQLGLKWEGPDETFTGEQVEINLAGSVSPGHEEDYSRIIFITLDITERKTAEAALRSSEEKYRLLFEANPMPMWIYDLESLRFLKVNEAAINHYGYCAEEFMYMTIKDIRPSEDVPKLLENIAHVTGGIDRAGVWEHVRKDGSLIQVEIISHVATFDGRRAELVLVNDITKRLQAEDELKRSHSLLNAALESTADGILVVGPDRTITSFNRKFLELWRIPPDLAEKKDDEALLKFVLSQLKDPAAFIAKVDALYRSPWEISFDELEFKDGRVFERYSQPQQLADEFVGRVWSFRDITERKQAEGALHESEQKYRNLVETSHDLIWSVDGDGLFTYLNQASREIYGYAPEELLGRSFLEILEPGQYALDWDAFKKNIAGGDKFVDVEGVVRHRDGRQIVLSTNALVLRDRNNNLIGIVGSSRDITERKRAEEALRESEERFSNAFEFAPIGMALVALEGRWLKVNQAICELVGYTGQELQGMTFQQITHPDDLEADLNYVKQLLAGAIDSYQMEKRYIHKSGRLVWVLLSVSLIKDLQGKPIYFISQIQDITERKQAEWEIQRRNQDLSLLDEVNQALNRNESLSAVIALVSEGLKHIFKGYGATIYLLDADRQRLVNQNLALPQDVVHNIEKLFGFTMPRLQFDLQRAHPFSTVFDTKKIRVMNDPQAVQQHYLAFAETVPLGPPLRVVARKIMPLVQKLVNVQAELLVPLISRGELIGVMDLGGNLPFTDDDVQRVESIASQLTAAIQRKRAEEALHYSEEQYRSLFEDSPVPLWVEDFSGVKQRLNQLKQEGVRDIRTYLHGHPEIVQECLRRVRIMDVNNAATRLFHAKHKDELLVSLSAAVRSPSLEQFERELVGILEGRVSFEWDEDGYTLTGEKISIHLRWSVVPGYEEGLAKVIVSMVDITERKQAEENLRRSETRYRLATKATNDVIWEWDAIAHQLLWSENAQVVFGYSEQEIGPEEKWWDEHIHPEEREHVLSTVNNLINGEGSIWSGEYRFRRKDGSYAHISDHAYIERDAQGNPLRMIGAMSDITERKKNEAETRRRAEETAALLETSLALTSLDLESTLQTFGERTQSLFEADGCRIFLMEPDGETLRCVLALQETPEPFAHLRIKLGVGVTGAVAASGRAEIVNAMQNDPRAMQIAGTPDEEEAIMFAPLKERERTIGVLSVRRVGTQRPFQPADLALLEALASMSASAVSNARLFEQTGQRLNELQALYENGLAVGRLLEPQAIGERIIQTVSQYLSWHHVTIRLCKENSDELELVAFHLPHMAEEKNTDDEQRFKFHVSRVGQGLSGWVVQTGSPIRTSNLSADPHYVSTYAGMQSGLYMPLNVGDRVMGVISVESEQPDAFSEQDERLLATLANQAATAFENARLYQSAQQEIHERRIAEEALKESEENYRRLARELEDRVYERTAEVQDLYDNAPCGYLSLDADGNIVRINQTELDWLGYTREEILGRPFADFVTYESHNIFKETFPTFKRRGSIRDLELEMQRKDNSILPILVSATAVYDQDGKYLTSRSTLSDDTSRKHAMETLRLANAEMKRAMRMKDEFLANMSHELRTPLNAILGLSESLLEQTAGPINEKQQKYLGTVNESGRHLLELINDILDLAKIESGQIKIDPGRVHINTACETSLRMVKQLAQKKNQTVKVEIEKEIGYVWADERRLKQMMVNLLSNAVKFTPVDGQLGLKASIDRREMKLLITIWDHGIGIREEDLSRLFRPFVQLDSGLARESAGTGLGLALVAEMARLHGGSVSVASQPGQGSEFTISLPWDPAITADTLDKLKISGKIPLMKRTSTEKQTILLVEDTDSVVLMLRDYLELSGYKVEIARDGLEGVSKAISVRPDLILMDVQMPGLDGLEATRRIRREDNRKNIPIIALTALAMPSDRARCLEAGMNDYLSKPINLKELAKAVLRNLPDSGTGKKS